MANAYDASTPLDTDKARFAAAELRAIKSRMDAISGSNLSGLFANRNVAINPEFFFDLQATTYSSHNIWVVDGWYRRSVGTISGTTNVQRIGATPSDFSAIKSSYYLRHTVATSRTPIGSDGYSTIQALEYFAAARLANSPTSFGPITVSFLARASTAGTYNFFVNDSLRSTSYVAEFSVPVANEWTPVTLNIPIRNSGTWLVDPGSCLYFGFNLGAASSLIASPNTWVSGYFQRTSSSVQLCSTSAGNTLDIANFQIESGTVINPVFERIPLSVQQAYCERYVEKSSNLNDLPNDHTFLRGSFVFPSPVGASVNIPAIYVPFRTLKYGTTSSSVQVTLWNPEVSANNQVRNVTRAANCTVSSAVANYISSNGFALTCTTSAGTVAGDALAVKWIAYSRLPV